MPNRLAAESSPYLRQHEDNPVEWWPWGEAAFAEARKTGKPVFVSIGYAACHWCHVMAHESFEDPAIAARMNERFVNVKVDREERPEVDAIYMNAIMVQGEGGGWPLSAFCLPDGRPYFLGTYLPPTPRAGRPSFPQMLDAMADAFRDRRADAEDNARALAEGLGQVDAHYRRGAHDADRGALTTSLLVTAGRQLAERCDPKHGGVGAAPKFPSSSSHALLARASRFPLGGPARAAFDRWAWGMADGGIYDHLGGGFARYAVDATWLVPHFEKMLYDQAQLLAIYADVVAMNTGANAAPSVALASRAREVIAQTVEFLMAELSDADGGLWSALDADSEGEEGTFYVWTPAQLRAALGPVNAIVFAAAYGVTDQGNFEHATSVLSRVTPRTSAAEELQLAALRQQLHAARTARVRPATDDKVLAAWNGLAISGLVSAWRASGHAPALTLALRVATFLRDRMIDGDRIARIFHHGAAGPLDGTLDDYACCGAALLELAEATGDRAWWDLGATLIGAARARFVAVEHGVVVFYLAPVAEPLVEPGGQGAAGALHLWHRPESHQDGALPSAAAVCVRALLRLGLIAGDADALALAERYLEQRLTGTAGGHASANAALLGALDLYLHADIVVVTAGSGKDTLEAAVRTMYAPTSCLAGPWASATILEGKTPDDDGRARAYVCAGQTCSPPVTASAELRAQLVAR